jgi:tRNA threonylcarbamoyladenosine biosynthesis protein TsaE
MWLIHRYVPLSASIRCGKKSSQYSGSSLQIRQNCGVDEYLIEGEESMLALGAELVKNWKEGDLVLLEGNLGAGKTTLVRGMMRQLGWVQAVRSPTFSLFSVYSTNPKVLHADLYRLSNAAGIGIEDYLDSHLCLVEWPSALEEWIGTDDAIRINIEFEGEGRRVQVSKMNP